jgi:hypothetical protein
MSQENSIPYQTIKPYPTSYTMGGIVSRMLDGLGYRYHWASKELRTEDLSFDPGNGGKTTLETLKHIYELSADALLLSKGMEFKRPREKVGDMSYRKLREQTLQNLDSASTNFRLMTDESLMSLKVIFAFEAKKIDYPFWNFLNGQVADALYHTGQIVSFRRSSGNPVSKEMNVFTGGM